MIVEVSDLERYAFLDPAGGKQVLKRTRSRSAIVVLGVDGLQRMFVLEEWAERAMTSAIVRKVFEVNNRWRPRVFGCEANAQQALFADMVQHVAGMRHIRLPLRPVIQPTTLDKDFRIRTAVQPVVDEGRLFVPKDCKHLRQEMAMFPLGDTADVVDALASCILLVPKRHGDARTAEEERAVREYLKERGVQPNVVERRIQVIMGRGREEVARV